MVIFLRLTITVMFLLLTINLWQYNKAMEVDFHWFYGALSQSLAALIGIVGMFIVYRLQTQESRIKGSLNNMRLHFKEKTTKGLSEHLLEDEIIDTIQKEISVQEIKKLGYEGELEVYAKKNGYGRKVPDNNKPKEQLENMRMSEIAEKELPAAKDAIKEYDVRLDDTEQKRRQRDQLKVWAFVTIAYLCCLFVMSVILLLFGERFSQDFSLGFIWIKITVFLLIVGMILLVRCCGISLDIHLDKGIRYYFTRNKRLVSTKVPTGK